MVILRIIFAAVLTHMTHSWHIYSADPVLSKNDSSLCYHVSNSTTPLSNEEISRWKMWPGLMSEYDREHGQVIYGYREAMNVIWENQHPKNCSESKFLIFGGWDGGFGSEFHVMGVFLALAVQLKRVLLLAPFRNRNSHPKFWWWTNSTQCREAGVVSLECYYEPLSSCTIDFALGETNFKDVLSSEDKIKFADEFGVLHRDIMGFRDTTKKLKGPNIKAMTAVTYRTIVQGGWFGEKDMVRKYVPEEFVSLLSCFPISPKAYYYWWRAISVSYLVRPNNVTLSMLKKFTHTNIINNRNYTTCVSVYVRRGDKDMEMQFVDTRKYSESAETLYSNHLILPEETLKTVSTARNMYFGSEDYSALEDVLKWSTTKGWNVMYSYFFDRRKVSSGNKTMLGKGIESHPDIEYFAMIFDLHNHLKCGAFVWTHGSNFCRLIDELRATVGGKANSHFIDLAGPDCKSINRICGDELNWR